MTSAPDTQHETAVVEATHVLRIPQYNVVLLDDNDHTYDYVIEMLMALFGHSAATAMAMATEVDKTGRVIVDTSHKERAVLKRDQIRAFGPDWRLPTSKGSMEAIIEPAAVPDGDRG